MNTLGEIEDQVAKMKILKSLLSNVVSDGDVITVLEEYIEGLESQAEEEETSVDSESEDEDSGGDDLGGGSSMGGGSSGGLQDDLFGDMSMEDDFEAGDNSGGEEDTGADSGDETILPSPADLELDLTDNNSDI